MSIANRPSIYDRLRPHLDAEDLIRRLGLEETRTLGSEVYCRPLCHDSTSGESLQINRHTGRWNCKACQSAGVYGDLIHLVEYALTGGQAPSKGGATPSHREALTWLCDQFGIPFDENRVSGDAGLDVVHLFAMAAHEHLLGREDVLQLIQEKWGFDRSTVEAYGLGFMPDPILPAIVSEAAQATSHAAFRSSGLGWYTADGSWCTRFAGRVTFPYLEHGRAVYLIGRSTPWTPKLDGGVRPPKYHKLSVHSDQRPHISERVTNDHLYNEPVMDSADAVVIAEGVADAVALSSLGVPVVSPVTISFNAVDLERFTRKARESKIHRVEILFDNELSGSGNYAARRAGVKLVERGIAARILTLPLGPEQEAARREVVEALGAELFDELERLDPHKRKALIEESVPDATRRQWITEQVAASKIDAAEWNAAEGAGAPGRFDAIRKAGRDVIELEVEELAKEIDLEEEASFRADAMRTVIELAAHIEDRLLRESYAGKIAKAAGPGVTKAEIARRIAEHRREVVKPARKKEAADIRVDHDEVRRELVLLPPEVAHTPPPAPAAPKSPEEANAPAAPPPPGAIEQDDHERYAPARKSVARCVEAKLDAEELGDYVAQTITRSMGFTPFRTPDELYLVRGSERIPVGLGNHSPRFATLLWRASGLTTRKTSHRSYIAATTYFLERASREASEVSWSYVAPDRTVYFPTGDLAGRVLHIRVGGVARTKMAEARVPAVAGDEFLPIGYVEEDGGVARALDAFSWTSISPSARTVLVYWLVCLPILRRVGTIPIVRIEGGSSSGKTRTVDAVSWLVNGQKSSSVPTAAALVSRMSTEMLTIDDNRETRDVSAAFLGTLLQATHLGAREKRRGNSDTGTVVERVCGALLMNGIEPIHDGQSELASRMLVLRCATAFRSPDSPRAEDALRDAVLDSRNGFWSESVRRCARALELDQLHGEELGAQIEALFGASKIGRLSAYLRLMVLAWIAGEPEHDQPRHLASLPPVWATAFREITGDAIRSLLDEEIAVAAIRYVFHHGIEVGEKVTGSDQVHAFGGKFQADTAKGDASLGPIRAAHLARLARAAGKDLNAPRQISTDLRAGQLERRILDGLEFLRAAGFEVEVETTGKGRNRFTFYRPGIPTAQPAPAPEEGTEGDTWTGP